MLTGKAERGTVAILVASTLILLIGMAAIAIDYGAGVNERRQDQTAADLAALGGGLEALLTVSGDPIQAAVDEAQRLVDVNLGRSISAAQWAACTDSDKLAVPSNSASLSITGGTACISFSQGFDQMRVRVPIQAVDTSFARVLGVFTLNIDASAEIGIESLGSGSYPAGVFAADPAGTELCIKTGTGGGGDSTSCGSPSAGGFGTFHPYFYNEIDPSQNPKSQGVSGDQTAPLSRVIAEGIDHPLGLAPSLNGGTRLNGSTCTNNPAFCGPAFPDRVMKSGGNQPADITNGLVLGGSYDGPYAARLAQGEFVGKVDAGVDGEFEILGVSVDNRPLWTFIDPDEADASTCQAVAKLPGTPTFPTSVENDAATTSYVLTSWEEARDLLIDCLGDETDLLFSEDLLNSHRVATVPRFWQTGDCGNNNCVWDIMEIVPIFIQGMWTTYSNQWTCSGDSLHPSGDYCVYEPGMVGEANRPGGNAKLDSVSALLLNCKHIESPPCVLPEDGSNGQSRNISIRLTK